MSKNFLSYGDSETIFTEYAEAIKDRPKVWEGRQEDWEALPDAEKEKWDYANFTDDSAIAIVTDDCEPDNPNAISSKGVYDHALIRVTQLPENPSDGDTVLYMGQNTYTYNAVTTQGTETPSKEGWYEQNGTDYILTEDTSPVSGKTYYERVRGLVSGGIYEYENGEWVLKSAETAPQITLDDTLDENSNNAVKNSAITTEVNKRLVVTDTMPTASADLLGQTRFYIGSTTANYQEGGIYKCESDGQTPPTYSWNIKNKADIDLADKQAIAQNTSDISDLQDDKQDKTLETPLTIDGTSQTTVEGALSAYGAALETTRNNLDIINRKTRRQLSASDLTALKTAITSGDFGGIDIKDGDYFSGASGLKYTLGEFNHFKGSVIADNQYSVIADNHYAIVVDCMDTTPWNSAGNTDGAYKASTLRTYLTETALPKVLSDMQALGFTVISRKCLESNAFDSTGVNRCGKATGCSSGWEWVEEQIIALSEPQVYGSVVAGSSFYDVGEANRQLNCFKEHSFMDIANFRYFWLKELSSSSSACNADSYGGVASGDYSVTNVVSAFGLIVIK